MMVPEPTIEPETAEEAAPAASELTLEEPAPADELSLDQPAEAEAEELLLGSGDMLAGEEGSEEESPSDEPALGTRSWLAAQESPAPAPRAAGGTLFERMSNIARGAAKAQVDEEAPARTARDPLDIPRFLNRQNNQ